MASDDQVNRRRQGLSWSLSFRSSRRKRPSRIVRPPTPPPTCEERVHYPVFNPHDPRHNPAAIPPSWISSDYKLSEVSSSTQNTGRWQSLSERSLRKARSGLDAIKAGMHRRPSVDQRGPRRNIPGLWMSTDSHGSSMDRPQSSFPSNVSQASTDDESEFGTDLHRTRCNGSSTWNLEIINRYLNEVGSSHALPPDVCDVDIGPAGSRLEGETLNDLSEENFELTRLPSKTQTITWDDNVQAGKRPVFSSSSNSVISSRPSTSSNESSISQLIDATQAFEALCSLDQSTQVLPDNSAVGSDVDDPLSAMSRNNTESLSEGAASRSNGSTRANSEDPDKKSCDNSEGQASEIPTDNKTTSRQTSCTSSVNASGGSNSSTGQGTQFRRSTQSDSTAPTSYSQSTRSTTQSEGNASATHTSWSNVSPLVEHDDVLSLPSIGPGGEHFHVDGKSNGFGPDQGTAIKPKQMAINEGNTDSSTGLGIHRSDSQMSAVCQLDRQPSIRSRDPIDSTDSTEDCFLMYTMFQKEYGS